MDKIIGRQQVLKKKWVERENMVPGKQLHSASVWPCRNKVLVSVSSTGVRLEPVKIQTDDCCPWI